MEKSEHSECFKQMSVIVISLTLVLVLTLTAYLYVQNAYLYWERKGVPFIKPKFLFGNFKAMLLLEKSISAMLVELYNSSDDPVVGVYTITSPALLLRDPKIIRDVLVKDFVSFNHRGFNTNENVDKMVQNMFLLNGEKWKESRQRFSPAFTSKKLKIMFGTIYDCSNVLDRHVASYAASGETIEIRDVFSSFATNVIASVSFGLDIDCIKNPNIDFRRYGKRIFDSTAKNVFRYNLSVLAPRLAKVLRLRYTDKDVGEFMVETVRQNMEYRERNNVIRKDFFQLLMQLRNTGSIRDDNDWSTKTTNNNNQKSLSLDEMAAEAYIFFIAGFESSSSTMSFCLYEMCRDPEVQEKAFKEISIVLEKHDGKLSYESLSEMTYMEHCIDETLRLHPPFGVISRVCTHDYKLPDSNIVIEKGTTVIIPIAALHRDPKYYEHVEKFKPERFDESARANKTFTDTYLPFGGGPRICIAFRLAKLQAKLAIVLLLQKYRFELSDVHKNEELKVDPKGNAKSAIGGINLSVKSREITF